MRAGWAARLGPKRRRRVGIVWQGNPEHMNDHHRSMPLGALAPLRDTDVDLVCVQKAISISDATMLRDWGVASFADDLVDFTATAALIDALDLVIAVDTSIAHLAGAMGKPVWVLLPCDPDFRWLLGRADSPWYPSMQLFRQSTPGGWAPVIDEVVTLLRAHGDRVTV